MRRANATDEKYELFRRYQAGIHGEKEDTISSRRSWERFLVDAPFPTRSAELPLANDDIYGVFHHEYRCRCTALTTDQGKLIAVGVVDVLPACISSVYVFYDPSYSHWQLGKLSALVEIELAHRLSAQHPSLQWYYMGTLWPLTQATIFTPAKK